MKILALDCGTHTGFATNCTGQVETGVVKFELRRGESTGMRYIRFHDWMREMLTRLRPEVVVYEAPIGMAHRGAHANELAHALTSRVQEYCERAKVDYRGVSPSVLKWHATGKGNAGKPEMIRAANAAFDAADAPPITDDDEADAVCLLAWALDGFPEREPARKRKTVKAAA